MPATVDIADRSAEFNQISGSNAVPRTSWQRTIGEDLQSQNFGVHPAWMKAKERDTWHQVVSTATLC